MPLYLISYDLDKPEQNYDRLIDALIKHGAKNILLSAWGLRTTSSSVQVRDWVRQYTDVNDRILVTPLSDWAAWNAMNDINLI
jgi:hypothetical protein